MDENLDSKSVIVALTDGIGAHLGKRARSTFFKLASRISRIPEFSKLDLAAKQQIVDILALSSFYNVVVFPLQSGSAFMTIARKAGASHIRMGKDKLTAQFGGSMRRCVRAFFSLLESSSVPIQTLSFATLSEFVVNVMAVAEEKEREALDRQKHPGDSG